MACGVNIYNFFQISEIVILDIQKGMSDIRKNYFFYRILYRDILSFNSAD